MSEAAKEMIFFQATEAGLDFSAGLEIFYLELEEPEQSEARKEEETKDFKKAKAGHSGAADSGSGGPSLGTDPQQSFLKSARRPRALRRT